jgi:hypothetical protein
MLDGAPAQKLPLPPYGAHSIGCSAHHEPTRIEGRLTGRSPCNPKRKLPALPPNSRKEKEKNKNN